MPDHECSFCHEPAQKRCSCKKVWYCSEEHQGYDWVRHVFDCNSRPVTTADYLALAVDQNLLPEHPQTCDDYGFSRTTRPDMLLGLYIGLIRPHYLGVKPKMLHKWRSNGTLVENIKKKFEGIPEASRGEYYKWFLQNQHVVSGAREEENRETFNADEMTRRAWSFIGQSPAATNNDIQDYIKSASEEERDCWFLYVMLLSRLHPSPIIPQWIYFGFCACSCQEDEMQLSQSYTKLINRCSFDEFTNAYTSCSLVALFRCKDIDVTDPLIIDVLSGFGGPQGNKSVWNLKQYIELKTIHGPEDTTIRPANSVAVDYGFCNCKTTEEQNLLIGLYKEFFALRGGADPLQLHRACIEGRLFTYLAQDLKLKAKPGKTYKRLLVNPYPLMDPDF